MDRLFAQWVKIETETSAKIKTSAKTKTKPQTETKTKNKTTSRNTTKPKTQRKTISRAANLELATYIWVFRSKLVDIYIYIC